MKIAELHEAVTEIADAGDMEAIELVKRDCQAFIKSKPGGLMFRGMKNKPRGIFIQDVRNDRNPRNMKLEVHEAADEWFHDRFGFKARSEAVFVSGELADAKSYGKAYAVFPIGEFKYVWSPDVGDLFILLHSTRPADVEEELNGAGYMDTQLKHAISSGLEIMVQCKKYYAIPMFSVAEADAWAEQIFES